MSDRLILFPLIVTAGQLAVQFSDNTVDLLDRAEGINLRFQLNIILDEKYTSSDKFDDAYKEAKELAQTTLAMLSADAKEKKAATDEIVQTLITVGIFCNLHGFLLQVTDQTPSSKITR
jgi:hypothetical protein